MILPGKRILHVHMQKPNPHPLENSPQIWAFGLKSEISDFARKNAFYMYICRNQTPTPWKIVSKYGFWIEIWNQWFCQEKGWCFCGGGLVVLFLWWCLCGGVFVVVFLWWCLCGGVFVVVFLWWCFCGGIFVVVFLWWCLCGGVFVVVFLWWCFCGGVSVVVFCGGVFVVVFLRWCFRGGHWSDFFFGWGCPKTLFSTQNPKFT